MQRKFVTIKLVESNFLQNEGDVMLKLLPYKSQRLLRIAEALLLRDGLITFEEIRSKNRCSNKTVYNDVAYLERNYQDLLHLEVIANTVESKDMVISDFLRFRQILMQESLHTRVLFEIAFTHRPTLYKICSNLMYSESRIRFVISELNDYLANYQVQINRDSEYNNYYFQTENPAALLLLLVFLLDDRFEDYISKDLEGHYLKMYQNHLNLYPHKLPSFLESKLKKSYMLYQAMNMRSLHVQNDPLIYVQNVHQKHQSIAEVLELEMKDFKYLDFNADNLEKLTTVALYYLEYQEFVPERFIHKYNRGVYFYRQFHHENPALIQCYEENLNSISKKMNAKLCEYKEDILFSVYHSMPEWRLYPGLKIGVFSDLKKDHAQSMMLSIEAHFPMNDYAIFDANENYDLIIATNYDASFGDTDYILISDFVSVQDIYRIYQAIYCLSQKHCKHVTLPDYLIDHHKFAKM